MIVLPLHINNNTLSYPITVALQHVLARMETSSQLEKHESPSASGTNVSGLKPIPKPPDTPFASGTEPARLSRPGPAGDDDSWLQRIDLRAVECCEEGIELSTPLFSFYHRWDPEYRTKKEKNMARASNADYEQWVADGKPDCLACGKRHLPPCKTPSSRKRQAEEPAEGSTTRASRRRRAVRRKHRAPAQTAPATMAPPNAPSDTRLLRNQAIATPESLAQSIRAVISEAPPQTATAPSSTEGWPTEGGWRTQG
jgi:hypothetical protein